MSLISKALNYNDDDVSYAKVDTHVEERIAVTKVTATYTNDGECMIVDKFSMQVRLLLLVDHPPRGEGEGSQFGVRAIQNFQSPVKVAITRAR